VLLGEALLGYYLAAVEGRLRKRGPGLHDNRVVSPEDASREGWRLRSIWVDGMNAASRVELLLLLLRDQSNGGLRSLLIRVKLLLRLAHKNVAPAKLAGIHAGSILKLPISSMSLTWCQTIWS
jgi:hypothetical protein